MCFQLVFPKEERGSTKLWYRLGSAEMRLKRALSSPENKNRDDNDDDDVKSVNVWCGVEFFYGDLFKRGAPQKKRQRICM